MSKQDKWTMVWFYFGNASWPSDATWRYRNDEYQVLFETACPSEQTAQQDANQYKLIEPFTSVYGDGHEAYFKVYLHGWMPSSKENFEEDKAAGWGDGKKYVYPKDAVFL